MKPVEILYIPVPDRETGRSLARMALERKLAACGNLHGPIESLYEWKGEMKQEPEWVLILKTTPERVRELSDRIEADHPYECPCVLHLSGEANSRFADWVSDS
jgi:periplasmic divalent cation tolerance protein